jgi:hypothetical protein
LPWERGQHIQVLPQIQELVPRHDVLGPQSQHVVQSPPQFDGNKELDDTKEKYPAMKSLLIEKWGICDIVWDQNLDGIKRVAMLVDPKDKVGMSGSGSGSAHLQQLRRSDVVA